MPTWPTLSTTLSLQRERNPTSFSYLRAKRDVVLMGGNEVGRWSAMLRQRLTGAVRNAILSLPCGINSTGRVLPLQGRSWRFESVIPHQQERALGVRPRSSLFRISTWAVARSQIRWRSQRFLLEHRLGLLGTHRRDKLRRRHRSVYVHPFQPGRPTETARVCLRSPEQIPSEST